MIKEITPKELKTIQESSEKFTLIDVREPHEKEIADIGGELIPLGTLPDNIPSCPKDHKIIIYCRSGMRSAKATEFLEKNAGFTNIFNLQGGILAWSEQVDPTLKKY